MFASLPGCTEIFIEICGFIKKKKEMVACVCGPSGEDDHAHTGSPLRATRSSSLAVAAPSPPRWTPTLLDLHLGTH